MDSREVCRSIAVGAYGAVKCMGGVDVGDGDWQDVLEYKHNSADYENIIQGLIPAIEEWIDGKELPHTDDFIGLGEDLVLGDDPLSFTTKYGDEYRGLVESFPEILVNFWFEDGLARAELNSVWMSAA